MPHRNGWLLAVALAVVVFAPARTLAQAAPAPALFAEPRVENFQGDAPALLGRILERQTTRRARAAAFDRAVFAEERIALNLFPDLEIVADHQDIGYTGITSPSWTGRLPNGGSAAFVINGDRISGSIVSPDGLFEVYPLGDGQCAIVEHDESAFPECGTEGARTPALDDPGPIPPDADAPAALEGDPLGDTPTGNRVRVLVAYTTSARDDTSTAFGRTMQEHIDLAVLESNQGYANSAVTMRMELACLYHTTSGTETTAIENDVANFRSGTDGKWNEVHGLRNDYDADMCCLITDGRDTAWCGWAFGFDYTSYSNMFQVTAYNCATGNFTFAHEFGHTQGCRHDNDGTLTPFPYGHGFRNGGNWRTVMGLASGTGALRLNYWSNPAINSPVSPFTAMGTPINGGNFANDCESALDVGDATVVNHQGTPATSSAPNGETFGNDEVADKIVTNTLTVNNFTAFSGSRVQFRAGNKIVLQPGFRARVGSEFRARIAGPLGDEPLPSADGLDGELESEEVQQGGR